MRPKPKKNEKLKNDIMFKMYGYLFYKKYLTNEKEQKNYRPHFLKILIMIFLI